MKKSFLVISLQWLVFLSITDASCGFSRSVSSVFHSQTDHALAEAVDGNSSSKIIKLAKEGANVNACGDEGITLLVWAMVKGNKEAFHTLLEVGANADIQPSDWYSTIALAAKHSDPYFLREIMSHGGDVNLVDKTTGETPIFEAIGSLNRVTFDLLVAGGAKLNCQGDSGETPMMFAAGLNRYDFVLALLEKGADPTIPNKWGKTVVDRLRRSRTGPNVVLNTARQKVITLLESRGIRIN